MKKMKTLFQLTLLGTFFCIACSNNSANPTGSYGAEKFEFRREIAHPNAQALMDEEFYWSPVAQSGPFGNDDGSDAAYAFEQWRRTNPSRSPMHFLHGLITTWEYPYFDLHELDTAKIGAYLTNKNHLDAKEIETTMNMLKARPDSSVSNLTDEQLRDLVIQTSASMGGEYLLGQDNAIIGTAFAQLALDGVIEEDLHRLTLIALQRELLPLLLNSHEPAYRNTRKDQLNKMRELLGKVKTRRI